MELHKALRNLFNIKGANLFTDDKLLNMLNDFNAYEEHPAYKHILEIMAIEGYLENIKGSIFQKDNWSIYKKCMAKELTNNYGYRQDLILYFIDSVDYAVGNVNECNYCGDTNNSTNDNKGIQLLSNVSDGKEHLTFKNIEITGTVADMVNKLVNTGTDFEQYTATGSAICKGTFAGVYNCEFLIVKLPLTDVVWKVVVSMPEKVNWYDLKAEYKKFKESLTKKYGRPESFEFFTDPYEEGDGYELTALSVEKCTYSSYFTLPLGHVTLSMHTSGCVCIHYEDSENTKLLDAQQQSMEDMDL